MTLPLIAISAALLYLLASKAGWLQSLGSRSAKPRPRPELPRVRPGPAGKDRLEVFEEFLRHLGRDDPPPDA